jgi:hypothetical protein
MVTTLTLPALAFLMAISGLPSVPGLKGLPGFRGLLHHKPKPTAADSLPPTWKHASRLALEHQFLQDGMPLFGRLPGQLHVASTYDPRKEKARVDPDSGVVTTAIEVGELRLGPAFRRPLAGYGSTLMRENFSDRWRDRSRRDVNRMAGGTVAGHTGLQLPIPVNLPPVVSSILGPGGPALNVSGSESIRLSGTSDWTNQQTGLLGQRRSLFPSLDMQQDLNIQLEGQLSDRVKVNLLQNSANQVPLANRIAINYRGDEDDLVQALDLGNTNLALPGTQYVSYSGRNEGLFGVKLATRVGPFDLTTLASKQEGRSERASYSGGASTQHTEIYDIDAERGRYFLLYDPQYGLYNVDDRAIQIFRDDGNYANDFNTVRGKAMVDPGRALGVPVSAEGDTAAFRGRFDLLKPIDDYDILQDYYVFQGGLRFKVIRLKRRIEASDNMCLAATYTAVPVLANGTTTGAPITVGGTLLGAAAGADSGFTELKMLRAPRSTWVGVSVNNSPSLTFDPTWVFNPVRELELKNFYSLQGFQLDPSTFKLTIQRGSDDPPRRYIPLPGNVNVNYLEALGLDSYDESQSTAVKGHDERVDGTAYQSGARAYVDFTNGVLWFPEPRPFAPRVTGGGARWFDQTMDQNINRRARLDGAPDSANGANPAVYDKLVPDRNLDSRYKMIVDYAAQRTTGEITLGRGNILEGSEVVTVDGERWTRDRDYTVDYDLGRLTLKRQVGPASQLNIDYSYAPLFAQAGKTLLGSAFRLEGRDRSLGGAFLYESKGAQDLRPRLGEEPSRTLITDVNGEYRFKSDFVTRMMNHLPGLRSTSASDFNVQAELGTSFPNPNTKNEVYVDDMEGVRDAVSLTLAPERWRHLSVPSRAITVVGGRAALTSSMLDLPGQRNAEIHWYVPPNVVKERDLKPTLSDAQGGNNPRQVLALSVPRAPAGFGANDSMWTGLTYQLDDKGIDLSRSQFIELWVNDFNDHHDGTLRPIVRGQHVKLHIDLGVVSEDQMVAPNRPPDNRIDTEDKDLDQKLNISPGHDEDTGMDGADDGKEKAWLAAGKDDAGRPYTMADLSTAYEGDPEGDDYGDPDDKYQNIDPRKFLRTNGTEGNKKLYPYPDTEDLNLNQNLDKDERYFEYTIDLGDAASPYLVTDLQAIGGVAVDNGWRRYRIPLADALRLQFGVPDLTIARHVRMWLEGLRESEPTAANVRRPLLMIGSVDIVGSRWQSAPLTDTQKNRLQTTTTLSSVNTIDNANIYRPPFDPGTALNGSQALTRREQSMAMEFTQLAASDTLEAYRSFSLVEDYSRYKVLRWYAASYDVPGYDATRDSLYYFVRFASDDRGDNYYEVKRRLPQPSIGADTRWEEVQAVLPEISNLKLRPDFPGNASTILYRTAFGGPGDSVIIKGRPSFTRLQRISFGLINQHAGPDTVGRGYTRGQLWFDELRATDVAKDVGIANRVNVGGRLGDVVGYNVAWNSRDADFLSVGETRGTGSRSTALAVTGTLDTQRFFAGSGITLPISYVYSQNTSKPRFTAGDDVIRTGAQQEASTSRSQSRTYTTSYNRTWSPRSNPLLRYTVGGLTANGTRTESDNAGPSGVSNGSATSANVNWGVQPRALLAIPMPFGKAKFYPLPERVRWNYQLNQTRNTSYTRPLGAPDELQLSSDVSGRTASLDLGADTRPFDLISHHIEAHRALSLSNVPLDHVGFFNLGRTTSWSQNLNTRYALQAGPWLRPSVQWSSNFASRADLQSENLSVHSYANGQNAQLNWTLPFEDLRMSGRRAATTPSPADTVHRAARGGPRLTWRTLLARLGNIATDAQVNRSSGYSRALGSPGLMYLFGLKNDASIADTSGRLRAAAGNSATSGVDWRASASSRIPVMFESSVAWRAGVGDRSTTTNGVVTRSTDSRFPDIDVNYGKVADAVKLTRFIKQPLLRTSWVRSSSNDYQGTADNLVGHSRSDDFHPLISLRGNLKNGTTVDLSTNVRSTVREVYQYGTSSVADKNTDFTLNLNRSYTQGQKVAFLGKTSTVRSSVTLGLATVYSHHTGSTLTSGNAAATRLINDSRLSITGNGSYGFSSTVTGSAVLGFSQTHDNTLNIVHRSVRVEVRTQFGF